MFIPFPVISSFIYIILYPPVHVCEECYKIRLGTIVFPFHQCQSRFLFHFRMEVFHIFDLLEMPFVHRTHGNSRELLTFNSPQSTVSSTQILCSVCRVGIIIQFLQFGRKMSRNVHVTAYGVTPPVKSTIPPYFTPSASTAAPTSSLHLLCFWTQPIIFVVDRELDSSLAVFSF